MPEEIRIILKNGEPRPISDFDTEETIDILHKTAESLTNRLRANRLEPCPFCGGKVSVDDIHVMDICSEKWITGDFEKLEACNIIYQVICSHCGASGSVQNSKEQAAENWNMRKGS